MSRNPRKRHTIARFTAVNPLVYTRIAAKFAAASTPPRNMSGNRCPGAAC